MLKDAIMWVLSAIFFSAVLIFASLTFGGQPAQATEKKSAVCVELLEWIVDGNYKTRVDISTRSLNVVALHCLGREADPKTTRPTPNAVVEYINRTSA